MAAVERAHAAAESQLKAAKDLPAAYCAKCLKALKRNNGRGNDSEMLLSSIRIMAHSKANEFTAQAFAC